MARPTNWHTKVLLPCSHEWAATGDQKFVNIEEDFDGADLLTYQCAECGQEHKSRVYA